MTPQELEDWQRAQGQAQYRPTPWDTAMSIVLGLMGFALTVGIIMVVLALTLKFG